MVDLGLIEADDIRLALLQIILKVLLVEHRTNAINIPGANEQLVWGLAVTVFPKVGVVFGLVGGGLVELLRSALWVFAGFFRLFGLLRLEKLGLFFHCFGPVLASLCFLPDLFWRHFININKMRTPRQYL